MKKKIIKQQISSPTDGEFGVLTDSSIFTLNINPYSRQARCKKQPETDHNILSNNDNCVQSKQQQSGNEKNKQMLLFLTENQKKHKKRVSINVVNTQSSQSGFYNNCKQQKQGKKICKQKQKSKQKETEKQSLCQKQKSKRTIKKQFSLSSNINSNSNHNTNSNSNAHTNVNANINNVNGGLNNGSNNHNDKKGLINTEIDFGSKIKNYRIQNLVKHFITKLKRTSVYRNPLVFQPFVITHNDSDNPNMNSPISMLGAVIQKKLQLLFSTLNIFLFLLNCVLSTFLVVFQQQIECSSLDFFIIFSIIWFIIQIALGVITIRKNIRQAKKRQEIKAIILFYLKNQFLINVISLISILFYFVPQISYHQIGHLFIFIKLPTTIHKYKVLQNKFIKVFYQEQHWGIVKMFLQNFFTIHVIAILFLLMSFYDSSNNWLTKKGINQSIWVQKYVWALYWAATTILTVGFGDIAAANYKEALTLVIIQTISCMTLAYNINLLGKLLGQLRKKQMQKQKGFKILKQLCDRSQLQSDLQYKLSNHIKQSYKMQTKFNFEEQQSFISKLPTNLKTDYLRESNIKILQKLHFMRNFTNKTLYKLAQKLQQKMAHPWQIIYKPQQKQIMILKQGKIGFCPNFDKFSQIVIDKFQTTNEKLNQYPKILSMNFVRIYHQKANNYNIKSLGYSILSKLQYEDFLQIIRSKKNDMQFYFSFKDRQLKDIEQMLQLIHCQQCKLKHSKFICPRLHYIPIPQIIINKYLNYVKTSKNSRKFIARKKKDVFGLKMYKFFQQNCGENIIQNQVQNYNNLNNENSYLNNYTMNTELLSFSSNNNVKCEPSIFVKQIKNYLQVQNKERIRSKQLITPKQKQQQREKDPISIKMMNMKFSQHKHSNLQLKSQPYPHQKHSKNFQLKQFAQDVKAQVIGYLNANINVSSNTNTKYNLFSHFWDLECDCATDYNYYFPQNNPKSLYSFGNQFHMRKSIINKKNRSKIHTFKTTYG